MITSRISGIYHQHAPKSSRISYPSRAGSEANRMILSRSLLDSLYKTSVKKRFDSLQIEASRPKSTQ